MQHSKNSPLSKIRESRLIKWVSAVSIAYFIYYLWWRASSTLNPAAPVFSWILLLAEAFGVLSYLLFSWMTREISPIRPHRAPKAGLSVDVFIPTYNESLEILEATMVGCNTIAYPHKTYVLDDGRREEVRRLAERLGCDYLTRPSNEHAKAGNINHALGFTHGEFIVILDADMVPQRDFLHRTLAYFEDKKLAVIQLPQEFYNQDSIQHDGKSSEWHEQLLFFRVIQPGKNYSDSAFWCGSPSLVRRVALEQIGGVATETITEDIHTSVRLHSHGWSSLFVNEPLAFGIAPQTIRAFLLQRLRWAQGTMQLYRSAESPLWVPGLSLKQRLSYLSSFLAYFESFQKLILLLTPTIIILFNVFPMRVNVFVFMAHWLPYFGLNVLANQLGGRGYFRYHQTERYNILKMIVFIESTLILFQRKALTFKVTPKTVDQSVYQKERQALRLYFAILGMLVVTIGLGFLKVTRLGVGGLGMDSAFFALGWALYNALLVLSGVRMVLSKPHERKQYRFPVALEGYLLSEKPFAQPARVWVENLSTQGAGIMTVNADSLDGGELFLQLDAHGARRIQLPVSQLHVSRQVLGAQYYFGLSFAQRQDADRERLFEYLFVDLPGRAYRDTDALQAVPVLSPVYLPSGYQPRQGASAP